MWTKLSRFIRFWVSIVLQLHRDTESFYHWRSHAFLLFLFLGCWVNSQSKNQPFRYRLYLRSTTADTVLISPALWNRNRTSTFAKQATPLYFLQLVVMRFLTIIIINGTHRISASRYVPDQTFPSPSLHWLAFRSYIAIYIPSPRSLACDVVSAFYTFLDVDTHGYRIQNCWKCYVTDCKRFIAKAPSILR